MTSIGDPQTTHLRVSRDHSLTQRGLERAAESAPLHSPLRPLKNGSSAGQTRHELCPPRVHAPGNSTPIRRWWRRGVLYPPPQVPQQIQAHSLHGTPFSPQRSVCNQVRPGAWGCNQVIPGCVRGVSDGEVRVGVRAQRKGQSVSLLQSISLTPLSAPFTTLTWKRGCQLGKLKVAKTSPQRFQGLQPRQPTNPRHPALPGVSC